MCKLRHSTPPQTALAISHIVWSPRRLHLGALGNCQAEGNEMSQPGCYPVAWHSGYLLKPLCVVKQSHGACPDVWASQCWPFCQREVMRLTQSLQQFGESKARAAFLSADMAPRLRRLSRLYLQKPSSDRGGHHTQVEPGKKGKTHSFLVNAECQGKGYIRGGD